MSVIVGGDRDFLEAVKAAGSIEVAGETVTPEQLFPLIEKLSPGAVLVSASDPQWLEAVTRIAALRRNIKFYLSGKFTMDQWRVIAKAQCTAVSHDPAQAAAEVSKATSGSDILTRFRFEDRGQPEVVVPAASRDVDVLSRGLTVNVFSTKGGSGKTTLALNIAATCGLWFKSLPTTPGGRPKKVLLLDYNPDYGTSKYYLRFFPRCLHENAPKTYSVYDWEDVSEASDWDTVRSRLNYYEPANLYYLSAPQVPGERIWFNEEQARKVINVARKHFDAVLIDMGVALEKRDSAVVALDMADKVLLVVYPKEENVIQAAEFGKLEMYNLIDKDKISLVVNHVAPESPGMYSAREVQKSLRLPLLENLPYEGGVNGKNCGPYVCHSPASQWSRKIEEIARCVLGAPSLSVSGKKSLGFFNFLKLKRGK